MNAGDLRAKTTKLLHFILSHPLDLICIQESNLNSSFFFPIPVFSALQSDPLTPGLAFSLLMPRTLATASSFFVRKGLSFSELSTSSLSLLDPYFDYVGDNIYTDLVRFNICILLIF